MRIAVIDADLIGRKRHRFPNLACMKLSGFHRDAGDAVELKTDYGGLERYDRVYLSRVFTDTPVPAEVLKTPNVVYGGTGFFYDRAAPLPPEVEHHMPDYHLYDGWVEKRLAEGRPRREFAYYLDYSIGFPWWEKDLNPTEVRICSQFIDRLCKFAIASKRVTAKIKTSENERFDMRCWLIRLGCSGPEYKELRAAFMKNLDGDTAFRYGRPEAQRRAEQSVNSEEAQSDAE